MIAHPMKIRRAFARAAHLAIIVACGCGQHHHPPPEANESFGSAPSGDSTSDGSSILSVDAEPVIPTCALGPNGGICACVDQPLLGTPPTLYFVLDRSGSMNESGKWTSVNHALFGLVTALGPRANIAAAVFPNPNSVDSCASGLEIFAPARGDSPAGTSGIVETAFLRAIGSVPPAGGTPTAATLEALYPRLVELSGQVYVVLATDGGPNCNQAAQCDAVDCTVNIESYPGCTPGGPPNCCASGSVGTALDCLDGNATVHAVSTIAAAGIPVYVMGMPGSEPYVNLLEALAQAGGTARASSPLYYAVGTADEASLLQALSSIAAQITGSCTLTLSSIPPDPSLVNVFLDEQPLSQSGPDGWSLAGAVVTILGASCQQILSGSVIDVRVVAGCPTYIR